MMRDRRARNSSRGILHTRVGHYKELVKFRQIRAAKDKRIQFAGDYFAPSSQNTASASGEQAAGLLISKLQQGEKN